MVVFIVVVEFFLVNIKMIIIQSQDRPPTSIHSFNIDNLIFISIRAVLWLRKREMQWFIIFFSPGQPKVNRVDIFFF